MTEVSCADCGTLFVKRSHTHKYCESCSARRNKTRARHWASRNPPDDRQRTRRCELKGKKVSKARARGAAISRENAESIGWHDAESPPRLLWVARISVPFSYAISKNHIYALRQMGHVALRRESKEKRQEIGLMIRRSLGRNRIVQHKLWIDLLVQKPNHKGDAVNVVDLVCDALTKAVGLDDRWFCIRKLDWQIVKTDPRLFIGIGQETDVDHQVCSYCGQIRRLEEFYRNKSTQLGVGRECKLCVSGKPPTENVESQGQTVAEFKAAAEWEEEPR